MDKVWIGLFDRNTLAIIIFSNCLIAACEVK
jgi:hypothetical protein